MGFSGGHHFGWDLCPASSEGVPHSNAPPSVKQDEGKSVAHMVRCLAEIDQAPMPIGPQRYDRQVALQGGNKPETSTAIWDIRFIQGWHGVENHARMDTKWIHLVNQICQEDSRRVNHSNIIQSDSKWRARRPAPWFKCPRIYFYAIVFPLSCVEQKLASFPIQSPKQCWQGPQLTSDRNRVLLLVYCAHRSYVESGLAQLCQQQSSD